MRRTILVPLLLGLAALVACGGSTSRSATPRALTPGSLAPSEVPAADVGDEAEFARSMNALGLDVWEGLRISGGGDQNMALSPASLATALAMTYGGARGETAAAMSRALHVASDPDATMAAAGALQRRWNDPARTSYELAVANRLFAEREYDFREAYLDATRVSFDAEVERLDFRGDPAGARVLINEWVEARTHDRIRDLIPRGALDDTTRLVLVNAVYFHGSWLREFDPERTIDLPFFVRGGSEPTSVPTMRATGGRYGEDEGVQLLELPYAGEELAMLIVLPRERNGLAAVEDMLDAERVARWAGRVAERGDLEVQLPRFRIETEAMALGPVLRALGMEIAFSDDADFSGISEPGEVPLKIGEVFHRVFVDVNEEGTEAAAATAVVMIEIESVSEPREPPRFIADHPFLFFLRDLRTGAILFAARLTTPGTGSQL
ncbi:MAG: serpin family protein [Myxococcota bacterium]|nr:serpin family protein [Myxococcota bacterium]